MDATTARLVDFAMQSRYEELPERTVHECKRRLIDTFAAALMAYDEPQCASARAVARRYSGDPAATIWGSTTRTSAEMAAFANGVMLRFLDITDTTLFRSRGHPSDIIPAILAIAEAVHADGRAVINAVTLGYDGYCSFGEAIDIQDKGWDNPNLGLAGGALGAATLLGLSREQIGDAVSLAITPNMALEQTRQGLLSSWKGAAGANTARNIVFATLLARDGFTGPTAVVEGKGGLWDVLGRFDWQIAVGPDRLHRIERTHLKCHPVCYHGQAAVWAAIEARPRVRVDAIEEIRVDTYAKAVRMMGSDESRWSPRTRETADHSLPYVVAVALLEGEVTTAQFSDAWLANAAVADIMRKVKVAEAPELTARFPDAPACRLSIRMRSGEEVVTEVSPPKGHVNNPLDDAQLDEKFRAGFRGFGERDQCETALRALRDLEHARDFAEVLALLVRRPR